jgi:hypothetical protein
VIKDKTASRKHRVRPVADAAGCADVMSTPDEGAAVVDRHASIAANGQDVVCAVAYGHGTICGCHHKPSMINAVAVAMPTPTPNARAG